jgi:FkbH-like protein
MGFRDLKKNLSKDFSGFPIRRLALIGDSATQFLAQAICGQGFDEKINFQIFEAEFNQFNTQLLDSGSELYRSKPDYVILYLASEMLQDRFARMEPRTRECFADHVVSELETWWKAVAEHSHAKVIQLNFVEINDGVFGHFGTRVSSSFTYQIKKLNLTLMDRAREHGHVFIANVAGLASEVGYSMAHDTRFYAASKVAFALEFLPAVAKGITDIVQAVGGNIKKCLALDLDNTLWGGVIGDDGMENIQVGELGMGHAFDALQHWAKQLKQRGIILAVCSKNDEENAKRPFRDHPDMILRLDDIAVFMANWDNKVDNLKRIQAALNIGFETIVFLDDNPFERNLIRELLPTVTVPELPEDPALVVPYLCSLNLFETASYSEEDLQRTRQYQDEQARAEAQKSFTSIDDYLRSLEMESEVKSFDDFSVPRVAQLTQRSNQFNLRTIRYTEADIDRIGKSEKYVTLSFQLADKFGDHGLIGVVILEKLDAKTAFIDTWIMSCRVLKRGMEEFIVNQMAARASAGGVERLVGEYLPTAKNKMVKDLYSQMGFSACNGKWELNLPGRSDMKTFIRQK